jgi:site-specific recombinase XerD
MATITEAIELYDQWAAQQVAAGSMAAGTRSYYQHHLRAWEKAYGAHQLENIKPIDLMLSGKSWHRVQAVKRLFRWALTAGIAAANPVAHVPKPPLGERTRVLDRAEQARCLRLAPRPFREFLLALRESMARPQEVREMMFEELQTLPGVGMYAVRTDFKGKARRREKHGRRIIPFSPRLQRLLERIRRRRPARRQGPVFLNSRNEAWSGNAVRIAMAALRERAGLVEAEAEQVVCYTWRHTAATAATLRGLRDRILAELLGHASTRTTARYQHLDAVELLHNYQHMTSRQWYDTTLKQHNHL